LLLVDDDPLTALPVSPVLASAIKRREAKEAGDRDKSQRLRGGGKSICLLSLAGYWHRTQSSVAGYENLFGEYELSRLCDAQQVLLSPMQENDFPGALHKVGGRDTLSYRRQRPRYWVLATGQWWLCHTLLLSSLLFRLRRTMRYCLWGALLPLLGLPLLPIQGDG
jgi:hypothetical protein